MTHAQLLENVRRLVVQVFGELGVSDVDQVRESILLNRGHYCGRRFDCPKAHAVWFVEENQLKVTSADGQLARVLAADQPPRIAPRRAA